MFVRFNLARLLFFSHSNMLHISPISVIVTIFRCDILAIFYYSKSFSVLNQQIILITFTRPSKTSKNFVHSLKLELKHGNLPRKLELEETPSTILFIKTSSYDYRFVSQLGFY